MTPFEQELVAALPRLKSMAINTLRSRQEAEDLVQDTALRALECRHQFTPGTNLFGWLGAIMFSIKTSRGRRRALHPETLTSDIEFYMPAAEGGQEPTLHLRDASRALNR